MTIKSQSTLDQWLASVNEDTQVFMDYYPNTVIPIYEFIPDSIRKAEVKEARKNYLQGKAIKNTAATMLLPVSASINAQGFTKHSDGDSDVHTTNGRDTEVICSVKLRQHNDYTIECELYLYVREVSTDHTTFSGSKTFYLEPTEPIKQIIYNFKELTFQMPIQTLTGNHNGYISFMNKVDVPWLTNFAIQFDTDRKDDGPVIGITGDVKFDVDVIVP